MDKNESLEVAQRQKDLITIRAMRRMKKSPAEIKKFIEGARVRVSLARRRDKELIKTRRVHRVITPTSKGK